MSAIDPAAKEAWIKKHLANSPPITPELREELSRLYAIVRRDQLRLQGKKAQGDTGQTGQPT